MPTSVGQQVLTLIGGGANVKSTSVGKRRTSRVEGRTMLPSSTDVLIVGAGPVGLTTATVLAARGLDVTVVDRQAEGANTSRAAVVHAHTLEVLDTIGAAEPL